MEQDQALLRSMWLASPALPVGGFSYSEGLEAAVESGRVGNEAQAGDWLLDQLALTLARADLPVVADAVDAWRRGDVARVALLNAWIARTRESAELRLQTEQMGHSMRQWLGNDAAVHGARLAVLATLDPPPTWPVAFALAAASGPADTGQALLGYAFGWAENMVQAAMKAVPLGQAAAQRMLARLVAAIPDVCAHARTLDVGARQSFAPMLAILSSQHETQYSRLFRS